MFQKDYIMRMIEQFTAVLAKIMGLKSSGETEEAQQVLNEALEQFTGLSEEAIQRLSYNDLINLVGGINEINSKKCIILAELLKVKADIYLDSDNLDKSHNLYLKSLNIYVETILASNGSGKHPNHAVISEIINRIKQFSVPYETQNLLFHYYESIAEYGKAENVLFELLAQDIQRDIVLLEGIAFYERLSGKSPEELEKGNLPMDEVLEGIDQIMALELSRHS